MEQKEAKEHNGNETEITPSLKQLTTPRTMSKEEKTDSA